MRQRIAAQVFPPGEFLGEELDTRGWTQAYLAERMKRPLRSINEIINGKKAITVETALDLSECLGTSPEYWLNLEVAFRLHIARRRRHRPRVHPSASSQ
ncbi:MAG TPA: HigA family addiction module antitoxin [Gemmataceae bacterium]|nr:HigA family addiction module antitoxin [Gemmataceae bacterium]